MVNQSTLNIREAKKKIRRLENEAEFLLSEIENELDVDKNIKLVNKYNNLLGRIETENNLVNGVCKKSNASKMFSVKQPSSIKGRMRM